MRHFALQLHIRMHFFARLSPNSITPTFTAEKFRWKSRTQQTIRTCRAGYDKDRDNPRQTRLCRH